MKKMITKDIENILPDNIRRFIENEIQNSKLQEISIKVNKPLTVIIGNKEIIKNYIPTKEELNSILKRISNYSIYAFDEEIKQGYLTIKGGHRIGVCGSYVMDKDNIKTLRNIGSVNIRICREILGCSKNILPFIISKGNILNTIIISPPKCGKTTLLRDITRNVSDGILNLELCGKKVSVIDERSEIGACYEGVPQLNVGMRTDVLDNCPKSQGIIMAIRSMAPEVLVCDEIGTLKDVEGIISALNSGVNVITTIHGYGIDDLFNRNIFGDLINNNVFQRGIVLSNRNGIGTIECVYDFGLKNYIWRNSYV